MCVPVPSAREPAAPATSDGSYETSAHAEGKFIVDGDETLRRLNDNDQVVMRYVDENGESAGYPYNPNGSIEDIAAICDATGRILGMIDSSNRTSPRTAKPPENSSIAVRVRSESAGSGSALKLALRV